MFKITHAVAVVATAALLLTGCATATAPAEFSPSETTLDEFFLMRVDSGWQAEERTSEQKLAAGMRACEQIEAGVPRDEVVALDGSDPAEHDNAVIVYHAAYLLCPAIV